MPLLAKHYRSDARLVRRILRGDRDLFGVLITRYTRTSYAIAYAHLGNAHDAEDVAQEAFLRAYRDLDDLQDPTRFGQWLLSIVRHVSVDRIRRAIRERRVIEESAESAPVLVPDPGRQELHELLRTRVDTLKVEHREVLSLHYFAGKSTQEIADLLGESREAVKKRLQRAREELSNSLVADLNEVLRVPESRVRRMENRTTRAILALPITWGPTPKTSPTAATGTRWWPSGALSTPVTVAGGLAIIIAASLWLAPRDAATKVATTSTTLVQEGENQDSSLDVSTPFFETTGDVMSSVGTLAGGSEPRPMHGSGGIVGRMLPPVPGGAISVRAERIDWEKTEFPPNHSSYCDTQTNAEGRFSFHDLDPGLYAITASVDGLLGVAAATVSADEAKPVAIELKPAESLEGRVIHADGSPAAGAVVYPNRHIETKELWNGFSTGLRAVTGPDGTFRFPQLFRGHWRLVVKAPDAATLLTKAVATGSAPETLALTEGGAVEGQVVDAGTGEPVGGVAVVVPGVVRRDRFETISDAEGRYRIEGVMAGDYAVLVFDRQFTAMNGVQQVVVQDGIVSEVPPLRVVVGGRVAGRVTDARTGEGLPGAVVTIDNAPDVPVVTEDDGRFTVGGLVGGMYAVTILEAEGYVLVPGANTRRAVVRVESEPTVVDFALFKGVAIRGTVTDGADTPLPGARVNVNWPDGTVVRTLTTGFDGSFGADDIARDTTVTLVATHEDGASAPIGPLQPTEPGVWPCVLRVSPAVAVTGIIVDFHGTPLSNWTAVAIPEGDGAAVHRAKASIRGEFRIEALPAGTYSILALPPGAEVPLPDVEPTRVRLAVGGGSPTIRLVCNSGLSIAGHVHGSIAAVTNTLVEAVGPVKRSTRTDEAGNYVIEALVEGDYMVRVSHDTCCSAERSGVSAGTRDADFVLAAKGTVSGRVVDARTQKAVPSFQVGFAIGSCDVISPDLAPWLTAANDHNGVFRLDYVDVGDVTVMVRAPGYADALVWLADVPEGGVVENLVVPLVVGGRFGGRVVDALGNPVAGASICLHALPETVRDMEMAAVARTDADGLFTVTDLPNGGAIIWVSHPMYAATFLEVEPRMLGSRGTRIVMQSGGILAGHIYADEPLLGFSVLLTGSPGMPHVLHVESDGRFLSQRLSPGTYRLDAILHDGAGRPVRTITRMTTVAAGVTNPLDWAWGPADSQVHGVISTTDPHPRAHLELETTWGEETIAVDVRDDGTFASALAPAGPAVLVVEGNAPDGTPWRREVACMLPPGQDTALDVAIEPAEAE